MILAAALYPVALEAQANAEAVLDNVAGIVRFERAGAAVADLGKGQSIALRDGDVATTGSSNSLAMLTLPDGSVITIGQNSRLHIQDLHLTSSDDAMSFVLDSGKIRFNVRSPKGTKPQYSFKTPLGTIGVGPGAGDLTELQDGAVIVSSYASCNAVVDTVDGDHFAVNAGESMRVSRQNGKVVASHDPTFDHATFAPFVEGGKGCIRSN